MRGFACTLSAALIDELAGTTEAAGYRTFWTNDMPDGDGLGAPRVAPTTSIRLGVGLLPVDRLPANEIIARIALVGLPVDRLVVGESLHLGLLLHPARQAISFGERRWAIPISVLWT